MVTPAKVIHFEIHAKDPDRAITFWSNTFGWMFTKWDGPHDYWNIQVGDPAENAINGGMAYRHGPSPREGQPVNGAVCTLEIENLESALSEVILHGGKVTVEKIPIHHIGWLAYFRDTEGNLFGLLEKDPRAEKAD